MSDNGKRNPLPKLILSILLAFASAHGVAAQSISSLSITSGQRNTAVTITGTGFGANEGRVLLTFGEVGFTLPWGFEKG